MKKKVRNVVDHVLVLPHVLSKYKHMNGVKEKEREEYQLEIVHLTKPKGKDIKKGKGKKK